MYSIALRWRSKYRQRSQRRGVCGGCPACCLFQGAGRLLRAPGILPHWPLSSQICLLLNTAVSGDTEKVPEQGGGC